MQNPTPSSYTSARLKLNYVEWGNADAPPLLLIHGGRDHCRNWDWVARVLSDRFRIIAPDLRGHGDSQWAVGNAYAMSDHVYDILALVEQLNLAPVSIIGHSLGGAIALKYTGLCPEKVSKVIAIEGVGPAPDSLKDQDQATANQRMEHWVSTMQRLAARKPRRYASQQEAIERMQQVNDHLSAEHAHHLAVHGSRQNEDGSYSWKYDPYLSAYHPFDMSAAHTRQLWRSITCPVLLVRGEDSWASNPAVDGRAEYFSDAKVVNIPDAGHWVHHDQFDLFMAEVEAFLL